MTVTARVARLLGPRDLVFEEQTLDPSRLEANQVFAVTNVSAISVGTERAAYVGDPPLRPSKVYPRVVGYCNVATVQASTASDLPIGARILTHQSHRSAFVCAGSDVLAIVPAELSSSEASVTYLAHLGLAALRRVRFSANDRVTVIGLGPIGLATVALASALGAEVTAVGNASSRGDLATKLGAKFITDSPSSDRSDVVVLTASSWSGYSTALRATAKNGRIAVLGFPGRTDGAPPFNPLESQFFYDKQLEIVACGMPVVMGTAPLSEETVLSNGMELLLRLATEKRMNLAPLVTDHIPWSSLAQVYERAAAGDKTLVTAVLDWETPA